MQRATMYFLRLVSMLALFATATNAAAVQRTFVASNGLDTNNCQRLTPCRSFSIALGFTDPNGEIIVLDSAGYGPVTINKSVSIISPEGVYGGVTVPNGQDGIVINGGSVVTLRGLTINGLSSLIGVKLVTGNQLTIDRCVINGHTIGVSVLTAGAKLIVSQSTISNNSSSGVVLQFGVGFAIDRTSLTNNSTQIAIGGGGATGTVRDSRIDFGNSALQWSSLSGDVLRIAIEGTSISDHTSDGIRMVPSGNSLTGDITISRSVIARSGTGLTASSTGSGTKIQVSLADSAVVGNISAGIVIEGAGALLVATRNEISRNGAEGVAIGTNSGGGSAVVIANTITNNASFGLRVDTGTLKTRQDNTLAGNNGGAAQTSGVLTALGGL